MTRQMNVNPIDIKLAPITHRVHFYVMTQAFKWFRGWGFQLPFVIVSRKKIDNWTFNAIDRAVFHTARVFRGEELP
jgi:hypothetical protein